MIQRSFVAASLLVLGSGIAQAQIVKLDGSSTVFPISEAVAEEFQKAKKGAIKVTVGISGTGGGFKKFCRGETDISNASRPIQKKEMDDCRAAGVSTTSCRWRSTRSPWWSTRRTRSSRRSPSTS